MTSLTLDSNFAAMRHIVARVLATAAGACVAGCAPAPRAAAPPQPVAAPDRRTPPPLPPIPGVTGPLALTVVYPKLGATIAARDSNFIFGSVGTGDATLTINGFPVPVEPNGAFIAWLPVPDSASSRYDLVAARGADTVRLSHGILLPPPGRTPADSAADTTALPRAFPDSGRLVALDDTSSRLDDTDRVVIARPVPAGTYKWFLLPGTVVQVVGRAPGYTRVRLDSTLDVWVANGGIRFTPVPARSHPLHRIAGPVRVTPTPGWVDVALSMGDRPPFAVDENGHDLVLTLYGTQAAPDAIQYVTDTTGQPLVRAVTWSQETSDRARVTIHLSSPPFGYLPLWTGSALVLRVRRPPAVDSLAPLAGRTIVVDAGHPPAGTTGPTGLYEPVVTLAVANALRDALIARGAIVVMTRTTADPVPLASRPVIARRANADVLVSVHLNAVPDGMNPFTAPGTGTYFFHPHSIALARAVQAAMVRHLGLRDLGIFASNLALVRPTWMPSVLCEGAFLIIPEQEAALRTPAFQQAYADGIADGLETYFRSLATRPGPA